MHERKIKQYREDRKREFDMKTELAEEESRNKALVGVLGDLNDMERPAGAGFDLEGQPEEEYKSSDNNDQSNIGLVS